MLYFPNWHARESASEERYWTAVSIGCGTIILLGLFAIGYQLDGWRGGLYAVTFIVATLGLAGLFLCAIWAFVWGAYFIVLAIVMALPMKIRVTLEHSFVVIGSSLFMLIIIANIVAFIHDPGAWWASVQEYFNRPGGIFDCGSPGCF